MKTMMMMTMVENSNNISTSSNNSNRGDKCSRKKRKMMRHSTCKIESKDKNNKIQVLKKAKITLENSKNNNNSSNTRNSSRSKDQVRSQVHKREEEVTQTIEENLNLIWMNLKTNWI